MINGKTFQNTIYTQERLESKNKTFFYLKNEKKIFQRFLKLNDSWIVNAASLPGILTFPCVPYCQDMSSRKHCNNQFVLHKKISCYVNFSQLHVTE